MGVIKNLFFSWEAVQPYFDGLLRAFWLTIQITLGSLVFSLAGGMLLAIFRQARAARGGIVPRALFGVLRIASIAYIDIMRGLPALLVIVMLYVSLPFTGIPLLKDFTEVQVAILALSLVYAAYLAEIFRAGIESVERGQVEAARSLGLSNVQSLRKIVLPQAVRRVLPPLLNEIIILSKDTTLASTIAVPEILSKARDAQAQTLNSTSLTVAAIFFLVVTLPLIRIVDRYIERDRRRSGGGEVRIP